MKQNYNCPCCGIELGISFGSRIRTEGVTLYCVNTEGCTALEQPIGYGRSKECAYEVIMHKWGKHLIKDSDTRMPAKKKSPETPAPDSKIDETISYE